jgi:hypothetical protein
MFEGEADMWDPGDGRPVGGVGQPHLAASTSLPWHGVLWSPLEPSHVDFTAKLHNYL